VKAVLTMTPIKIECLAGLPLRGNSYTLYRMRITCSFSAYITFQVPKDIKLMSEDDNNKPESWGKPGSWYIRWGTLHYFDKHGNEQEMEPECEPDIEWKNPVTTEVDNDNDEDESDDE